MQLEDAYLSVSEALRHAAALQDSRVQIEWVDSERLEEGSQAQDPEAARAMHEVLEQADGILIPGGFGGRGIEGKIVAAKSRASGASPTWASVWACRSRWPSSRATWRTWRAPTPPSSIWRRPTR